jgi:hypothetical protein
VLGRIVDAVEHHVLVDDVRLAVLALGVAAAGVDQLGQRVLAVDGHQLVAQLVVRRVQRHGHGRVHVLAQPVDERHQPRSRHGDLALGQAEAVVVEQDLQRRQHLAVVGQGLAHAHEHHVGDDAVILGKIVTGRQAARGPAERLRREPDLRHDLGGGQVAREPLRAGRAERAVHGAADLRGDAQRAAVILGDEHGLDGLALARLGHPFARAVGRGLLGDQLRRTDDEHGGQLGAQFLAEVGHQREVVDAAPVDPAHHLVGAVRCLAHFGKTRPQRRAVETEQVDGRVGCGGHDINACAGRAR